MACQAMKQKKIKTPLKCRPITLEDSQETWVLHKYTNTYLYTNTHAHAHTHIYIYIIYGLHIARAVENVAVGEGDMDMVDVVGLWWIWNCNDTAILYYRDMTSKVTISNINHNIDILWKTKRTAHILFHMSHEA